MPFGTAMAAIFVASIPLFSMVISRFWGLEAITPARVLGSSWFRGARGTVTLGMTVTGLGYGLLLSDPMSMFAHPWINYVIHLVMPVIALLDWLLSLGAGRPP